MGNKQISEISNKLGVSRFTVRRALDHCAGVGSELRQQILDEHAQADIKRLKQSFCDAYVILPEIPAYFWGALHKCLSEAFENTGISVKYNIYSKTGDKATVENYLNEAEQLGARCIIIAAVHDGLSERLTSLARGRAVFSLCNDTNASNVFFFGSDHISDGYRLGKRCMSALPESRCFVLIGEDRGWRQGVTAAFEGKRKLIGVPCSFEVSSAQLARELDAICKKTKIDAVIGLDGINAKIALAIKKCRLDVPLFGFEHQPIDDRLQKPAFEIIQDLPATARAIATAVGRFLNDGIYPSEKYTFIPSIDIFE